eukprot:SAG31_NODE_2700_length_5224_cov_2.317854_4_plen_103_part_00
MKYILVGRLIDAFLAQRLIQSISRAACQEVCLTTGVNYVQNVSSDVCLMCDKFNEGRCGDERAIQVVVVLASNFALQRRRQWRSKWKRTCTERCTGILNHMI